MENQNSCMISLGLEREKNEVYLSENHLTHFHDSIFNLYAKYGETAKSIRKIKDLVRVLAGTGTGFSQLQKKVKTQLLKMQSTGNPVINQIIDRDDIKINMHCVPSLHKIPAHCHPGKINIIYVLAGSLQIEQSSLRQHSISYCDRISSKNPCVGLKNYRNIHMIRAISQPCIFLSIRLKNTHTYQQKNTRNANKRISMFFLGLLMCPLGFASDLMKITCKPENTSQQEAKSALHINAKSDKSEKCAKELLKQANQLREDMAAREDLTDEEDAYQATQLYLRAAKLGNAEAQYWLGVMYLDGVGITDDTDEAFRWVSAAAEQEYPAAKELLHIMLTTDEILDC